MLSFTWASDLFRVVQAGTDQKDDLPQAKFKFINSIKLMEKTVRMTYSHAVQERRTEVDGSVEFNEDNKMAVHHVVGTEECKLKYTYQHGERQKTIVEPTYYVAANTWDLVVSRKLDRGDALKASYQASAKKLELEWRRDSNVNGTFKVRWSACSPPSSSSSSGGLISNQSYSTTIC